MKTSTLFIIMGLYQSKEKLIELTNGEISEKNLDIIHEHLIHPKICKYINGFIEQDGIVFFRMENGEMVSVVKNNNKTLIWNKKNYLN